MTGEESGRGLIDLVSSAFPGARIAAAPTEAPAVEHMYKPREQVFGAVAREMVAAGWSVFPQESDGNRRPGTVNNEMIKWSEGHKLATQRPTPSVLDLWCSQCAHLNVAVVLGPASGHTFVIDIDVTEEELSAQIQELAESLLGRTPLRRVGRWPKMALVYRHAPDDPVPGRSPKFAEYDSAGNAVKADQGLEIISSGQAMTFYGKHHRTGRYFNWLEGPPHLHGPETAPVVTSAQVNHFLDAVDSVRQFHKSQSFDSTTTTWEWDDSQQIHIPRLRTAGAATNWVEDENGRVVDGRESYLKSLALRIVLANPHLATDPSGAGPRKLTEIVVEQFTETAEATGRWRGNALLRDAKSKVERAAAKVRSGELRPRAPQRDENGAYVMNNMLMNFVPPQPRRRGGDSLDFLPPFVDVHASGFDPRRAGQRRPIRCRIHEAADGAERQRRIAEDRTQVAGEVSKGLTEAFSAFWDEVYDEARTSTRVHILKAPTGAGKTSRGIQFIATDPRTKRDYTIRGKNGEIASEGRCPIAFLLPTYANIDELRTRAQVLNLDPGLPDEDLRAQAAGLGLIHEDELEGKLAELRRDARSAGLETMIYSGKLKAGCKMEEKVRLAMEAGIGTAGFCKAEVPTDGKDEAGRTIMEERFCPFYVGCKAIEQREQIARSHVVFLPHAFLSLQIPEELKNVRAVVADERIHHLFLHTATFELDAFESLRKPPRLTKKEKEEGYDPSEFQDDRKAAIAVARRALLRGDCPVEALAACPELDPDGQASAVRWVRSAIRTCGASIQRDGSVTPDLTLEQVKELCALPTGRLVREEYRFWKIVDERLETRIEERKHERLAVDEGLPPLPRKTKGDREYRIQNLEEKSASGEVTHLVRISWREQPNWVDRPLLLLDASAAPAMISKIWSGKEVIVHDIPAQLNVRIVGVVDRTYSNASVIAPPSATAQDKLTSARLLSKVRKVIAMLSGLYGWSRVVAGGSILVRRAVNADWEGPHNVDWCHFGAMRGLDFAKHHAAAISVGRMELPIRTIDGLVAALTYDDDEPEKPYDLKGTGLGPDLQPLRTPMGTQRIRMRSGHDIEMPVPIFPGRWGRMIQRQYREEELLQFLGRLRPVYREGDAPIWFSLSSVIPEDVVVDDLIVVDDLLRGSAGREVRLWEVMRRSGGVIDPEIAMAVCDDLYSDRRTVVEEMRAVGLDPAGGPSTGRASWGVVGVRWGRGGDAGVAYVRADLHDPEEALRNARLKFLNVETSNLERISQSRGHTLARGRFPDKIEAELGTLHERAEAERRLASETAMEVLERLSDRVLARLKDATVRPVPLSIPIHLDDGEGEDVSGPMEISVDEISARRTIERLWHSLGYGKAQPPSPSSDQALLLTQLNGTVAYDRAGDHVHDDDANPQAVEFDEADLIPY